MLRTYLIERKHDGVDGPGESQGQLAHLLKVVGFDRGFVIKALKRRVMLDYRKTVGIER